MSNDTNPDVTTRFNPDPTLIDDHVTARYDSELSHIRNTRANKSLRTLHRAMTHVIQRLDYQLGLTDDAARHARSATDNQEALALTHVVLSGKVPVVLRDMAVAVLCDHPVSARALLHRVAVTNAVSEARAMALTLYALIGHHNQVTHDLAEALDAARSAQPEHSFASLIARAHADNKLDQVYEKAMTESADLWNWMLARC